MPRIPTNTLLTIPISDLSPLKRVNLKSKRFRHLSVTLICDTTTGNTVLERMVDRCGTHGTQIQIPSVTGAASIGLAKLVTYAKILHNTQEELVRDWPILKDSGHDLASYLGDSLDFFTGVQYCNEDHEYWTNEFAKEINKRLTIAAKAFITHVMNQNAGAIRPPPL